MNDYETRRIFDDLKQLLISNEKLRTQVERLNLEIARNMPSKESIEKIAEELNEEVLKRIHDVNELHKQINADSAKLTQEIAELRNDLRNKAGMWGAAAGLIPSLLSAIALMVDSLIK